jgi:hypothetical protein
MKRHARLWAALLTATMCAAAHAGDTVDEDNQHPNFFARLKPRGGWNPDGRGIFHWWNPHCYPRSCAPDDYCRKPMPNLCRPFLNASYAPSAPFSPPVSHPDDPGTGAPLR